LEPPIKAYRYTDTRYTRPASYFWCGGKIICFHKVKSLDVVSKHDLLFASPDAEISPELTDSSADRYAEKDK